MGAWWVATMELTTGGCTPKVTFEGITSLTSWDITFITMVMAPTIATYRRKFRSQTSDNMDRLKAEQGRGREKRKIRRKKSKKKEDADARKGRKVAKHCVFPNDLGLRRVEK